MKILFIAPHLSTGGSPQYLLKKIKELVNEHEIYCIEYSNVTGGVLIVQRTQIEELLGKNLITLGESKLDIINYIKSISPDVIHFEEMPEYFCDSQVCDKIYVADRNYKIIETSHDSSFDVKSKRYFPDQFIFVSEYQKQLASSLNIPATVVEYPIEYKNRTTDRDNSLLSLGLDPSLKHVINVGLFTQRKNQAEIIEYAKKLKNYPIQFHFIGNQAENFKWYWEPLMKDFPSNCKWWNERKDVDKFYECADLFLFTSRGHATDKETMPLVIREAIGWNVPSLIYNLPVYLNYFDKYQNIEYLDFNDLDKNCTKIINKLQINDGVDKIIKDKYIIWSNWDSDQQQMHFGTNKTLTTPILVSLKEYSSDAVFWSIVYPSLEKNMDYWISPMPIGFKNLKTDPNVSGIKICVYNNETGEQLYECPYFNKLVDKLNLRLSNSIPYYMNFEEFFINNKYKSFFTKTYENVVDVGANVGVFSTYLLKNKITKKIIAVECDPVALKDLYKNFEHIDRIKIINKALSTDNNSIELYKSIDNPVTSAVILNNNIINVEKVKVNTVTVKELIEELSFIDLLKIDIEGYEYDILNNLENSLFSKINNIFVECHFFKEEFKPKFDELIIKLKACGYKIYDPYELTTNFNHQGKSESILFKKL